MIVQPGLLRLIAALVLTLGIGMWSTLTTSPWWAVWIIVGPLTVIYVVALTWARREGARWDRW